MPNVTFRIVRHSSKPVDVVAVEIDGVMVAMIYPGQSEINVVSAHFRNDRIWLNNAEGESPPIPSIAIPFDPQPYTIEGGKLVRQKRQ